MEEFVADSSIEASMRRAPEIIELADHKSK
jgi:hypothetical protein